MVRYKLKEVQQTQWDIAYSGKSEYAISIVTKQLALCPIVKHNTWDTIG